MAYVIGIYDEDKNIEIKLFSNSDNVLDKYKELNLFF